MSRCPCKSPSVLVPTLALQMAQDMPACSGQTSSIHVFARSVGGMSEEGDIFFTDCEIAIPSVTHLSMFSKTWLQTSNLDNRTQPLPKLSKAPLPLPVPGA